MRTTGTDPGETAETITVGMPPSGVSAAVKTMMRKGGSPACRWPWCPATVCFSPEAGGWPTGPRTDRRRHPRLTCGSR